MSSAPNAETSKRIEEYLDIDALQKIFMQLYPAERKRFALTCKHIYREYLRLPGELRPVIYIREAIRAIVENQPRRFAHLWNGTPGMAAVLPEIRRFEKQAGKILLRGHFDELVKYTKLYGRIQILEILNAANPKIANTVICNMAKKFFKPLPAFLPIEFLRVPDPIMTEHIFLAATSTRQEHRQFRTIIKELERDQVIFDINYIQPLCHFVMQSSAPVNCAALYEVVLRSKNNKYMQMLVDAAGLYRREEYISYARDSIGKNLYSKLLDNSELEKNVHFSDHIYVARGEMLPVSPNGPVRLTDPILTLKTACVYNNFAAFRAVIEQMKNNKEFSIPNFEAQITDIVYEYILPLGLDEFLYYIGNSDYLHQYLLWSELEKKCWKLGLLAVRVLKKSKKTLMR